MQMEEQEARLIQGVLNLSEDEVRQITRFRRGEGLLCIGYNHVPIAFHATRQPVWAKAVPISSCIRAISCFKPFIPHAPFPVRAGRWERW